MKIRANLIKVRTEERKKEMAKGRKKKNVNLKRKLLLVVNWRGMCNLKASDNEWK